MTQASTSRSLWQGGGGVSSGKPSSRDANALRRPALYTFFAFEVFCMTFLQKIVIPINLGSLGGPVQVVLPLTYAALFVLIFFVKIKVDINRLLLMSAFFIAATISIMAQPNPYSANSVLLMAAVYLPFILYIEVSESTFLKLVKIYINFMLFFGCIAFLQYVTEFIWTWRVWPNLDKIVPPAFLFDGFVYMQGIKVGSQWMKPTGVVFLEISYLSQWTAIALALELVYFRRLWRMIFFGVVLFACFAGTGLLLLIISGPVLASRLSRRSLLMVGLVMVACVITIFAIDWVGQVQHRFLEFQHTNTSGHNRFITPFDVLANFSEHISAVWTGDGPGSGDKSKNEFWWVITKLTYEYGYMTTISFFAFFVYVIFNGAPSQRISFMMLIFYNFMGGFIIPVYPLLVFLLVGLFRIRQPKPETSSSSSGKRSSSSVPAPA